jgi:ComF family protein
LTDLVPEIFAYGTQVRRFVADRLARAVSGLCCCCGLDSDTHSTLCSHCLLSLPRIEHACAVCGLSCESNSKRETGQQSEHQGALGNRCARCLIHPPSYALCRGAFAYATPIDQLIADYKFNERLDIGAGLSEELGLVMEAYYAGVRQEASTRGKPCAVIAVPLHPRRFRQRGFDQARLIAQRVAHRLALPNLSDAVARTRHTTPQTEVKTRAERQANLIGAFGVLREALLNGCEHVIVIDDVVTTTATVSSLTETLLDAGVKRVDVWCLARAERSSKG